jgi:hypothetical protein
MMTDYNIIYRQIINSGACLRGSNRYINFGTTSPSWYVLTIGIL